MPNLSTTLEFKITNNSPILRIPVVKGSLLGHPTAEIEVDWGDDSGITKHSFTDNTVVEVLFHKYDTIPENNIVAIKIYGGWGFSGKFAFCKFDERPEGHTMNKLYKVISQENLWIHGHGDFKDCTELVSLNKVWGKFVKDANQKFELIETFAGCTNLESGLSIWKLEGCTKLEGVFKGTQSYQEWIRGWNISEVTSMKSLFEDSAYNDKSICGWTMTAVEDTSYMFKNSSFNQWINTWFPANNNNLSIQNISGMFEGASFNSKLSDWNLKTVTDASYCFKDHQAFTGNFSYIESWFNNKGGTKTFNIQNIKGMFEGSNFNNRLANWDMTTVTDASDLFKNNTSFNQWIMNWFKQPGGGGKTWDIQTIAGMFEGANAFNQKLSNWDLTTVKDMSRMFKDNTTYNGWIKPWLPERVNNNTPESRGETPAAVEHMDEMFAGNTAFNQKINTWDVRAVKTASGMFKDNTKFTQFLGTWLDTTSGPQTFALEDTSSMFEGSIYNNNLSKWNMNTVKNVSRMFANTSVFDQYVEPWFKKSEGVISHVVENVSGIFEGAQSYNKPTGKWDLRTVTNASNMFKDTTLFNQPISNLFKSADGLDPVVEDISGMFDGAAAFNQKITDWNLSTVKNASKMFANNTKYNQWMNTLFAGSNVVEDVSGMFENSTYNGAISNWKFFNATNASNMFKNNSTFNQYIEPMFNDASVKIEDLSGMFEGAESFNKKLTNWKLTTAVTLKNMFKDSAFNDDIGEWFKTSDKNIPSPHALQDISGMFSGTSKYGQGTKSIAQKINQWDVRTVKNIDDLFNGNDHFDGWMRNWNSNKPGGLKNIRTIGNFATKEGWTGKMNEFIADVDQAYDHTSVNADIVNTSRTTGTITIHDIYHDLFILPEGQVFVPTPGMIRAGENIPGDLVLEVISRDTIRYTYTVPVTNDTDITIPIVTPLTIIYTGDNRLDQTLDLTSETKAVPVDLPDAPYEGTGDYTTPAGVTVDPTDYLSSIVVPGELNDTGKEAVVTVSEPGGIVIGPSGEITIVEPPIATVPPGGTLFTGEFPDSDGTPPPDYKEQETITPPTITIGGEDIDLEELLDQPISTEVVVNNSQPPADAEIQISEPGGIVIDEKGNVTIVTPPKAELPAGGTFIPGTPKDTDGDGNPDMETPVPYTFPEDITTPVKDVNIELESGNGQDYVVKLWDPTGQIVVDTGNDLSITGVKVGDTIVMNNQTGGHAVRIDAPDGSTVASQPAGQTLFSYTVQSTGVYKYICNVHPNMQGTIEVTQSPVISPSDYLQDAGDGVKNETGTSVTTEVSPPGGIVLDPETGEVTVVVPPAATIPPGNILITGTLKDDDGDGEPDVQTPVDITIPGGTITNTNGPDVEIDDYLSTPLGKKIKNNSNPPVNTVVNVDNPGGIVVGPNGEVEVVKPPVHTLKPGWTLIEGPLKDEDGDGLPDGFAPETIEYRFTNVTVAGGGTKEVLQLRKILPNRTGTARDTATTWSTVYGFESDAQYGTAQAESAGWFDAGVNTDYDDYHGSSILLNGGAGEIGFIDATHASEPDGYIHLYYTVPGDDTHNWTTGNGVNTPSKLFVYYNDTEVTANGYGIDGAHVVEKVDATSNPLEPGPQSGPGTVTGSTSVTKQAGASWDGYVSGTGITFVDDTNGASTINNDNGNTGTDGYQVWVGDLGVTETFYPIGISQNTGAGSATVNWDYGTGSWSWYWSAPNTTFRGDESFTIEWMNDNAWQKFEPYMFGQSISAASADYQSIKAGTSTAEITIRVEDAGADTPGQMTGDIDVSYTASDNSSNIYDGLLTFSDPDGSSDIADSNVGGWYSVGVSSAAGNKGSITLQQNDLSTVGQYKYYAVPGEGDYVDTFTVTWYDNAGNVNQHDIVINVTDESGGGTGGGDSDGTWSNTSPDGTSSSSEVYTYDPAVDNGYINQVWFADADGITQNAPYVSTQGQYGEAYIDLYDSTTGFVDYSYVSDGSFAPVSDDITFNWIDDAGNDNYHTITIEQTSDNGGGGGGGSRTFTLDGKSGSVQVTDDPYATPTYDGIITVKSGGASISDNVYGVEFSGGGTTAYTPNGQFTILYTTGQTISWRYESFYKEAAPYNETVSFYWNVDPEGTNSDELSISVTTSDTGGGGGTGGGDPFEDAAITGTSTYSVDPWSNTHPTMNNQTSVYMDAGLTYSNTQSALNYYDVTTLSGDMPQHGVWNSSGQGFGSWVGTYTPYENVENVTDEFTLKYTMYYYDENYNYAYKDVLKTYTMNIGSLATISDTPGVTTGDTNITVDGYATGMQSTSYSGILNVQDDDGTTNTSFSWVVTTPPTHGQVVVSAGSYTYTPNADYSGGDSFQLKWLDDQNFENLVDVNVYVNDHYVDKTGEVSGDTAGAVYVYDSESSNPDEYFYGQLKVVDENGFSEDTNMAYWVGDGTGTAPVTQESVTSSIDTTDVITRQGRQVYQTLFIDYAVRAPIDGSTGYSVNTIRWTDSFGNEQDATVAFTVKPKPVAPTVTLRVNYDNAAETDKITGQFAADSSIASESMVRLRIDSDLMPMNPRVFEDGGLAVIDSDFLHNSTDRFWHTNVMDRDTPVGRDHDWVTPYTGRSLKDLNKAINKTAGVIYLPVNEFDSDGGNDQWKTYIRQFKFDTSATPTDGVDVVRRPTDADPNGHWNYVDSIWYLVSDQMPVTDIVYDELGNKLWIAHGTGVQVLGLRSDGSIIEDTNEDGYFYRQHNLGQHDHGELSLGISPYNGVALAGGGGSLGDGDLYRMRRGIQYDQIEGVAIDTGEIEEESHENMTFVDGPSNTNRVDWMKPTTDGTIWLARNVYYATQGYYSHWISTTPNQDHINYLEGLYTYYNANYYRSYPTDIAPITGDRYTTGMKLLPDDQNLKTTLGTPKPAWMQGLWSAYTNSFIHLLEPHRHDMFEEMIETDRTYILIPRFNVNNTTWSASEKLYVWVSFDRGNSWNKRLLPVEYGDIFTGYSTTDNPWGDDQWLDSFTQNGNRVDIVRRRANQSARDYQVISSIDGGDTWFVDDVLSSKVDLGTGLPGTSTENIQLVNTGSNYLAFTRSTAIRTIGLAASTEITDLFDINISPLTDSKYLVTAAYKSQATGRDINTPLDGSARVLFSNYNREFDGPRFGYKVDAYVDTPGEIDIESDTVLYENLVKFDNDGVKIVDNNELIASAIVRFKDTGGVVNIGDNLSVTSSLPHVKIETEVLLQVPEDNTASYKVNVTSKPGLTTPGTGTIIFDWSDDVGSVNQHTIPLEIISSPADIPGVMSVIGSITVQLGQADEVELEFMDPNGGVSVVTGSSQYGDVNVTQLTDDDGAPIDNKYTLTYTDNGQVVWDTPQAITIDWQDGDGNQYQDEVSINLLDVDSVNPGSLNITGNDQIVTIGNTIQGTFECTDLDGVRSDSIGISISYGEFTFTVGTVEDNVVTGTWSYTAPDQYTTVADVNGTVLGELRFADNVGDISYADFKVTVIDPATLTDTLVFNVSSNWTNSDTINLPLTDGSVTYDNVNNTITITGATYYRYPADQSWDSTISETQSKITGIVGLGGTILDWSYSFHGCVNLTTLPQITKTQPAAVAGTDYSFEGMFLGCTSLVDINLSEWDTSKTTSMKAMFKDCTNLTNINTFNWDTSNVTDFSEMFENTGIISMNDVKGLFPNSPTGWNMDKAVTLARMFAGTAVLDVAWIQTNVGAATDFSGMFAGCTELTVFDGTWIDTSNATTFESMFEDCVNLTTVRNTNDWNTTNVTTWDKMFKGCTSLKQCSIFDGGETTGATSMVSMFEDTPELEPLPGFSTLDVGNLTPSSMDNMLKNSGAVIQPSVDIQNWTNTTNEMLPPSNIAGDETNNITWRISTDLIDWTQFSLATPDSKFTLGDTILEASYTANGISNSSHELTFSGNIRYKLQDVVDMLAVAHSDNRLVPELGSLLSVLGPVGTGHSDSYTYSKTWSQDYTADVMHGVFIGCVGVTGPTIQMVENHSSVNFHDETTAVNSNSRDGVWSTAKTHGDMGDFVAGIGDADQPVYTRDGYTQYRAFGDSNKTREGTHSKFTLTDAEPTITFAIERTINDLGLPVYNTASTYKVTLTKPAGITGDLTVHMIHPGATAWQSLLAGRWITVGDEIHYYGMANSSTVTKLVNYFDIPDIWTSGLQYSGPSASVYSEDDGTLTIDAPYDVYSAVYDNWLRPNESRNIPVITFSKNANEIKLLGSMVTTYQNNSDQVPSLLGLDPKKIELTNMLRHQRGVFLDSKPSWLTADTNTFVTRLNEYKNIDSESYYAANQTNWGYNNDPFGDGIWLGLGTPTRADLEVLLNGLSDTDVVDVKLEVHDYKQQFSDVELANGTVTVAQLRAMLSKKLKTDGNVGAGGTAAYISIKQTALDEHGFRWAFSKVGLAATYPSAINGKLTADQVSDMIAGNYDEPTTIPDVWRSSDNLFTKYVQLENIWAEDLNSLYSSCFCPDVSIKHRGGADIITLSQYLTLNGNIKTRYDIIKQLHAGSSVDLSGLTIPQHNRDVPSDTQLAIDLEFKRDTSTQELATYDAITGGGVAASKRYVDIQFDQTDDIFIEWNNRTLWSSYNYVIDFDPTNTSGLTNEQRYFRKLGYYHSGLNTVPTGIQGMKQLELSNSADVFHKSTPIQSQPDWLETNTGFAMMYSTEIKDDGSESYWMWRGTHYNVNESNGFTTLTDVMGAIIPPTLDVTLKNTRRTSNVNTSYNTVDSNGVTRTLIEQIYPLKTLVTYKDTNDNNKIKLYEASTAELTNITYGESGATYVASRPSYHKYYFGDWKLDGNQHESIVIRRVKSSNPYTGHQQRAYGDGDTVDSILSGPLDVVFNGTESVYSGLNRVLGAGNWTIEFRKRPGWTDNHLTNHGDKVDTGLYSHHVTLPVSHWYDSNNVRIYPTVAETIAAINTKYGTSISHNNVGDSNASPSPRHGQGDYDANTGRYSEYKINWSYVYANLSTDAETDAVANDMHTVTISNADIQTLQMSIQDVYTSGNGRNSLSEHAVNSFSLNNFLGSVPVNGTTITMPPESLVSVSNEPAVLSKAAVTPTWVEDTAATALNLTYAQQNGFIAPIRAGAAPQATDVTEAWEAGREWSFAHVAGIRYKYSDGDTTKNRTVRVYFENNTDGRFKTTDYSQYSYLNPTGGAYIPQSLTYNGDTTSPLGRSYALLSDNYSYVKMINHSRLDSYWNYYSPTVDAYFDAAYGWEDIPATKHTSSDTSNFDGTTDL